MNKLMLVLALTMLSMSTLGLITKDNFYFRYILPLAIILFIIHITQWVMSHRENKKISRRFNFVQEHLGVGIGEFSLEVEGNNTYTIHSKKLELGIKHDLCVLYCNKKGEPFEIKRFQRF
ncbi:hypothetical protein [Terribacillus saccharophilus]|uniref:hypothetical protein n=1 Tax=Terribacillus saccharophilus TaxID=361277 RepID=UPI002989CDB3|nr:hypothetical protein [Terribacillus saccharophilus]MCM3227529.1 hypothetical protein [Terribacillus saccharophilus]